MRAGNVYWLIAAIAVAVVTIALAAFIVVLAPGDPNLAAAAVQQQVPGPKLEAMADSHRDRRAMRPVLAVPTPSATVMMREPERRPRSVEGGWHDED